VQRLALSTVLLRKGRAADEIADISKTMYNKMSSIDQQTFQRLREMRIRYARLMLDGPDTQVSLSTYHHQLQGLASQANALEAELIERSAPLRTQRQVTTPENVIARVAVALPKDSVLIELIAYIKRPLRPSHRPQAGSPSEIPRAIWR